MSKLQINKSSIKIKSIIINTFNKDMSFILVSYKYVIVGNDF